jgi:hypothetical protein
MKDDTRCTIFNIMKILAVMFANFLILKAIYVILSQPGSFSKVEYAYMLLGFIMLFGGTFASAHEFCDDNYDGDIENKSEEQIIKEEMRRRNSIKEKNEEQTNQSLFGKK